MLSEVEKFTFPHVRKYDSIDNKQNMCGHWLHMFCLLSILSYEARMIITATALYSSFKV